MRARAAAVARRGWGWATAHPLLVVAMFAGWCGALAGVQIWQHSHLGSFDPDEAGYLAAALRYQRELDPSVPLAMPRAVFSTVTAPLVPVLSVPFLILGPRDPRSAMMVQPVLLVFTAVAAAGIARRLSGPVAAMAVGAYVAAIPTVALATSSYWFGLGAAAAMAGAFWALLASDGCANRWRFAYGLGIGAMVLTRTMALGFVPVLVGAGLVVAWGDRRRLVGLAQAVGVAVVVAAPWYIVRRHDVFGYLVGYGYGSKSQQWGPGGVTGRLGLRLERLSAGLLHNGEWWTVILLAVVLGLCIGERGRRAWNEASEPDRRSVLALAVVVSGGNLVLLSTPNRGIWFELPLVVLAVALIGVLAPHAVPAARGVLLAVVLVMAILAPPLMHRTAIRQSDDGFRQYDRRFRDRSSGEAEVAEREWWAVNEQVAAELARLTERDVTGDVVVTGNMFLVNSNTLTLAAELHGWQLQPRVPDATAPASVRARDRSPVGWTLRPDGSAAERFIVVVRHDLTTFTPDKQFRRFDREARAHGWSVAFRLPLPTKGEVVILRHRAAG